MSHRDNLLRIIAVHIALGPLRDEVVYVGGATVSLYADREAEEVRETKDVDVLLEIWTLKDFAAVEEQLRNMGFANDRESGVIVRYRIGDLIVDIMPTGQDVLSFGNKWYPQGYTHAVNYTIDQNNTIKIFSAPFFLASKLEAFKHPNRENNNNGFGSRDFEDIVYVLENRFAVWEELAAAPAEIKAYLKEEFSRLLLHSRFTEWLAANVGFGSPPATYYIISQMEKFVQGI